MRHLRAGGPGVGEATGSSTRPPTSRAAASIENVPRALPPGLGAAIRRGSWPEPPIFGLVRRASGASDDDMFSTFNMGVGMVLVVDPEHVEEILRRSQDRAFVIGEVRGGRWGGPRRTLTAR